MIYEHFDSQMPLHYYVYQIIRNVYFIAFYAYIYTLELWRWNFGLTDTYDDVLPYILKEEFFLLILEFIMFYLFY